MEDLKEWIDKSTTDYMNLKQGYRWQIPYNSKEEVIHNALIVFWKVFDMVNSKDKDDVNSALRVIGKRCQIQNIKGMKNLYWD